MGLLETRVTRGELLGRGAIGQAREWFQEIRSYTPPPSDSNIERTGEIVAGLILLAAAWQGTNDPNKRLEASPVSLLRDNPEFPALLETTATLREIIRKPAQAVQQLSDTWYRAYHHCTTTYKEVCTGTGSDRECRTESHEDCQWDDPQPVKQAGIDHQVIASWHSDLSDPHDHVTYTYDRSNQAYDLSRGNDSIAFQEVPVGQGGQLLFALPFYTIAIGWFRQYEEIIEYLHEEGISIQDVNLHLPFTINPEHGITRRTVLKVGSAAGLFAYLRGKQLDFLQTNAPEARKRAAGQVEDLLHEMDRPDQSIVESTMHTSLASFRRTLDTIPATIDSTLQSGYTGTISLPGGLTFTKDSHWDRVHADLEKLKAETEAARRGFDDYFHTATTTDPNGSTQYQFQVPRELARLMKYVDGSDKLARFSLGEQARIYTRHPENILSATLWGTLAVGLIEFFIKATDAIGENHGKAQAAE